MKSGRCNCKKRARVLSDAPRFVADDASTELHGSVDIVPFCEGLATGSVDDTLCRCHSARSHPNLGDTNTGKAEP